MLQTNQLCKILSYATSYHFLDSTQLESADISKSFELAQASEERLNLVQSSIKDHLNNHREAVGFIVVKRNAVGLLLKFKF